MRRRTFIKTLGKGLAASVISSGEGLLGQSIVPSSEPSDQLVLYPDPPIPRAEEFTVMANGKPVYAYNAGTFRGASFSFAGSVAVEITHKGKIHSYSVNPVSKGITATREDRTLRLHLTSPQKLEIQINGATSQVEEGDKLFYLFADALETDAPDPKDPNILYFGPGRHQVPDNVINFTAQDQYKGMYLAPGALVEATVEVSHKKDFNIYGRGFLRNPFTVKHHNMLTLGNCIDCTVKDIHLYDSIDHVISFSASTLDSSRNVRVTNVKSLHYVVNSDGLTFRDAITNVTVDDCFIVGNDNLIVIGGGKNSDPVGPSNNVVKNCTFIKSSYAGNWCFPQGSSPPATGGSIGPGNLFVDCDIIRANGEKGLITIWWGTPNTIDNLVFDNVRVQSFAGYGPKPEKTNTNTLFSLQETDFIHRKEMTLRNMQLPPVPVGEISAGLWVLNFDHVSIGGKPIRSDADLNLKKPNGVVTRYR